MFIGHAKIIRDFENALNKNRLSHAYLFQGLWGIGKRTCAFYLASHLLSSKKGKLGIDNTYQIRSLMPESTHENLLYIGLKDKETIGVEEVRTIIPFIQKTSDSLKIIIIDAIDDLTINAANALLKILEDPPAYTVFFIINHLKKPVLPTILSRCQKLSLKPLSQYEIKEILQSKHEIIPEDELKVIIKLSKGSAGLAKMYLEAGGYTFIQTVTNILISVLENKIINPSSVEKLAKDNVYDASIYLIQYCMQQIFYAVSGSEPELLSDYFSKALIQKLCDFTLPLWLQKQNRVNYFIYQNKMLQLDRKTTLLTLFSILTIQET